MSLRFLRELFERAVKTFAQALAAVLTAGATNLLEVPWGGALAAAGLAALLSVLTSVASAPFGAEETPSLIRPEDEA